LYYPEPEILLNKEEIHMSLEGAAGAYRDPGSVDPAYLGVTAGEALTDSSAFEAWDADDAATLEAEIEAREVSDSGLQPETAIVTFDVPGPRILALQSAHERAEIRHRERLAARHRHGSTELD
jgi:hypothetical protein